MNPSTLRTLSSLALVLTAACSGGDGTSEPDELVSEQGATPGASKDGDQRGEGTFEQTGGGGGVGTGPSTGGCVSSPANMEIPGNGCDDNGNGETDEAIASCDEAAAGGGADAYASALGLCQRASSDAWGLVSASFSRGAGSGVAPGFGKVLKSREGSKLGILQTTGGASGSISTCSIDQPNCGKTANGLDVVELDLELKVPANAKGIAIDYNFFSSEWPMFVGSKFNDGFVIRVTGKKGAGNIAFDAKGGAVDVNNGFFDRCTPGVYLGCRTPNKPPKVSVCAGGAAELAGTPFATTDSLYDSPSLATQDPSMSCFGLPQHKSSAGATGWLSSQTPVEPGETIYVNIAIWNAADHNYASLALVDNIRWIAGETTATTTTRPPVIN